MVKWALQTGVLAYFVNLSIRHSVRFEVLVGLHNGGQ